MYKNIYARFLYVELRRLRQNERFVPLARLQLLLARLHCLTVFLRQITTLDDIL
jgi:hypothetical protein